MKKSFLIKLHLYSGLFVAFYLLAFGFSAIVMNHQIDVENKVVTKTWTSEVMADSTLPDLQLAESLRDQLGIMGWLPRWEFRRDSANFSFSVVHPGRKYQLKHVFNNNQITISEMPKGFLAVFHGLHFLNGKIPNAPFLIRTWAYYQWTALFVMTISLVLGIWLWLKYSYRPWEGIAFGGLLLTTILVMMLI